MLLAAGVVCGAGAAEIPEDAIPLTSAGGTLTGGYYYLDQNITLTTDLTITGGTQENPVILDLNGFILTGTGSATVITINNGKTFTLKDTSNKDCYYYTHLGTAWTAATQSDWEKAVKKTFDDIDKPEDFNTEGTIVKLTGGIITGGNNSLEVGGVKNHGFFTMDGGNIVGCTGGAAGGVYTVTNKSEGYDSTSFTMTGNSSIAGCIANGSWAAGGAVRMHGTDKDGVSGTTTFNMENNSSIVGCLSQTTDRYIGGVGLINGDVTFNMRGNTKIAACKVIGYGEGGAVGMNCGTFNMYSNAIITKCYNCAPSSPKRTDYRGGGGVCVNGGTFNMYGGTISDCKLSDLGGGGVDIKKGGTFNMYGGSITNCTCGNSDTEGNGGGVYVESGATFNISGNAQITNNHKGTDNNNVYLASGTKIHITGALTDDASIGVTMQTIGQFTDSGSTTYSNLSEYFTIDGDDGTRQLYTENGEVYLVTKKTVTFNTNGGSSVSSQDIFPGKTITTPSDPTNTGFTFVGWYKEAACINAWTFDTDTMPNKTLTLYAKWKFNNDPTAITGLVYTGSEQTGVASGTGYTVTGNTATDAGNYTATAALAAGYCWSDGTTADKGIKWSIAAKSLASGITISTITDQIYNKTALTPAVTVTDSDRSTDLVLDTDYTVAYSNNINAGTATVTINGQKNYQGSTSTTFTITPKEVSLSWGTTEFTYNGNAQKPDVTVGGVIKDDTCTVTVSGEQTNAGEGYTATAAITGNTNYKLPANYKTTFSISPKEITSTDITWSGSDWTTAYHKTYTGEDQSNLITAAFNKIGQGATGTIPVDVTITKDSASAQFKNAGTYTATVTKQKYGDNNYIVSSDLTQDYVMDKADVSVTKVPAKVDNLVYTGSDLNLITAGEVTGGTIKYSTTETGTYTTTIPTGTNAGEYSVYWKVDPDENHNGKDPAEIKVSIAKADVVVNTPPAAVSNLVYTGSAQELITEGEVVGGTLKYSLSQDGTYSEDVPTGKNAGEYTVYWKVDPDENHKEKTPVSITANIAKADPVVTAPTAIENLVYTGTAQTLITAATTSGGTLNYKVSSGEYATALPTGTNAGSYTVYYKVVGNDNYNDTQEQSITANIAKADPMVTAPTAIENLIYTGSALALVSNGESEDGTFTYSTDDKTYGSEVPTGTDAGDYSVYWKFTGDKNHNDKAGTEAIKVTIAKADPELTAPAAKTGLIYTGSALALIEEGTSEDGTFTYSTDGTTYVSEVPTGTDAGDYSVYWKFTGDKNHNDVPATSLGTITITPASITAEMIAAIPDQDYTGSPVTPEPAVTFHDKTLAKGTDYTVTYKDNTNPGTATATITGQGNFTGSVDKTFIIKAAVYDVAVTSGTANPTSGIIGTTITVTADTAAEGKAFDKWVCNSEPTVTFADETAATTTFTMPAGDVEVEATYKAAVYEVTVTGGKATPTSGSKGDTITVTADAPAEGKVFDHWTSVPEVTFADVAKAETTFTMPASDVAVTATYKAAVYDVTVTSGTATPTSGSKGDTITVTADAPAEGKVFDHWTSEPEVTFADAAKAETTFTMPASDVAVTATYKEKPAEEYSVTVTATGGHGTASASPEKAAAGTEITLTATADTGYVFDKWESDVSITGNKFTMPARDVTVNAVFKAIPPAKFNVTVVSGEHGTAFATPQTAEAGTEITLTAKPDTGYVLDKWESSDSTLVITGNTFEMPARDVTVNAVFKEKPAEEYSVTVTVTGGHGTASASPEKAAAGTEITLTAKPDTGYVLDKWESSDSTLVITGNTFDMPARDVTVNAVFKKTQGTYISGTIENTGGQPVTLKLMLGATVVAEIKTEDGTFLFENTGNNVYNIVAESGGEVVKIVTVIADTTSGNVTGLVIEIPKDKVNSRIEIKGEDTPDVAVGNLEKAAEGMQEEYPGADTLELILEIEKKDPEKDTDPEMKLLSEMIKGDNPKADFTPVSIGVKLYVDGAYQFCNELNDLLEIYIPYDTSLNGITVYRVHNTTAEPLKKITAKPGTADGQYYLGKDGIYVYADKFSYYAVSYTPVSPTPSSSGGGAPANIFVKATVDKGVIGDYGRDATKDVSNWPAADAADGYKFTVSTIDAAGASGTLTAQVAASQAALWGWGDHDFKMYQVSADGTMTALQTVYSGERNGNWQYVAYYTPTGGVDTFVFKAESGATEDKAVAVVTATATVKPTEAPVAVQQTAAPVVAEQTALPTAVATKVATAAATAAATEAAKSSAPLAGLVLGALGALLLCRRK